MKTSKKILFAMTSLFVSNLTTEGQAREEVVVTTPASDLYIQEKPTYVVPEGAFDTGYAHWAYGGWGYPGHYGYHGNHDYPGHHDYHGDHHGSYHHGPRGHGGGHRR